MVANTTKEELVVEVKNIKKSFKTYKREAGLLSALSSVVTRKYKTIKALNGVSFSIKKGELVGFIGPNGAGKSTTIKAMAGVLLPDSGTVKCLGFNPWEDRVKYVKNIGVVFGPRKSILWWDLPAIDTYYLLKDLYEVPEKEFKKRLKELTKLLDIGHLYKTPVRNLSLGERMKANLVVALLHKPKLVFLDEPTVGVDIVAKEKLHDFIKFVNKEYGTTVVLTTHDMADIENLCKRIIVINKGKVIYDGPLEKVKKSMKRKILNVTLGEKVKSLKISGCKINKISDYELKIIVDLRKTKITDVMVKILNDLNVLDITVQSPDITTVIKRLYGS